MARKPYPSDVTDEEWDFVAPYLTLMTEDAPQREHDLREVFNGMRYVVRGGQAWRMLPNDLPPWPAVYQQAQRWIAAGVFEAMTQDLRRILRLPEGRREEPSAAVFDSRTLQSTAESADTARATTGPNGGRDRRCTWPSTRWATCFPCT
jgi:transposase